ncbi:MAG: hypothetical protein JWO82_2650, partial [Akkermansiaceae bacterium]|nr:hypothetical protein [Akkermansiaceae bacterium]
MAIIIHPSTGSTAATGAAPLTGPSSTADAALSTPRTSRSEAFRQAWRELSLRPATRDARLDNQRKLLKLWAGFDLDGALRAAAEEGGSLWFEGNNVAQLFEVFADDFSQHPEEAWRILARNDFGLDQCQLQCRWLEQLHDRPGIIISHLGEMNSFQQAEAMSVIRNSSANPAEIRTALMKSGIGESQLADFLLSSRSLTPGDSMDWAAQPAGPERTAARADWVAHLATLDPAAYAAAWETVPAADRAEVARLTVKMLHDSPL